MQRRRFINNERLKQIRDNTDWKKVFITLGLNKDEKKSKPDDWWALSPFTKEKTSSFHINDKGFYCFSTQEKGGVIELVQKVIQHQTGQAMNCYDVGNWLLENGLSFLPDSDNADNSENIKPNDTTKDLRSEGKNKECGTDDGKENADETKENKPIKQNLVPLLSMQGEHPEFVRRGISKSTCEYLGCGYLEKSRSPLQGRIVFQVKGIEGDKPIILTHIGRATTEEQKEERGKWSVYGGFAKTLEIYNIDKLFLDDNAKRQAKETNMVLLVEGCFDVAKLIEAGIYNVGSTLGAHLSEKQIPRLKLIAEKLGINKFFVFYDRDNAGQQGQESALALLKENGFKTGYFNWNIEFKIKGKNFKLPGNVKDVCEFSVDQLEWLRKVKLI